MYGQDKRNLFDGGVYLYKYFFFPNKGQMNIHLFKQDKKYTEACVFKAVHIVLTAAHFKFACMDLIVVRRICKN